jgi:hypothetical protein
MINVISEKINPLINEINVNDNHHIVIFFDARLNESTIDDTTFIVEGSLSGTLSGERSAKNRIIIFNPDKNFQAGEKITVTLTSGITRSNGDFLENFSFEFIASTNGNNYFHVNNFQPGPGSLTIENPWNLVLGDLNGDNLLDIVTRNGNLGNIVLLNKTNSPATFENSQSLTNNNTIDLALGDLDRDGDLDLVVGNYANPNQIFRNNGDGTFANFQSLSMSQNTTKVALGDVDGDGDLDLFVASDDNLDRIWFNDGDGSFTNYSQISINNGTRDVVLGDVDGNGSLDLVVGNYNNYSQIFFNDGDGNFNVSGQINFQENTTSLALGDLDGDGDLDLVLGNYDSYNQVLFNNGEGYFSNTNVLYYSYYTTDINLGDVDGDGDLDIVAANYSYDGELEENSFAYNVIWFNDGDANFSEDTRLSTSKYSTEIVLGDLDGDRDLDFITNSENTSEQIWLNDLTYIDADILEVKPTENDIQATANTDIDITFSENIEGGESGSSLFVNGSFTGPISGTTSLNGKTLKFNSDENFQPGELVTVTLEENFTISGNTTLDEPHTFQFQVATAPAPGTFFDSGQSLGNLDGEKVALGDVDGDGDLDAIFANDDGYNTIFFNNGLAQFTDSSQRFGYGDENSSLALGDVDGDGDLDIVIGNFEYYTEVFLNNGSGTFVAGASFDSSVDWTTSVGLGDFDGDGDLDLVESDYYIGNLVWFNDGNGNFEESQSLTGEDSMYTNDIAIGDVDGDGDLDIVEGNDEEPNRILLNNGRGIFSDSGQRIGNNSTYSIALGDMDGDGDLDIVEGNDDEPTNIWLNDGNGNFNDRIVVGDEEVDTDDIVLGDLDGDGDLDIIEANHENYVADRIWFNNGNGDFSSSVVQTQSHPQGIALGDLDGDGDLDILEGSEYHTSRVWLNLANPPTVEYTENEAPVFVIPDTSYIAYDIDDVITEAKITIVNNYEASEDVLSIVGNLPSGMSSQFDNSQGVLTLSGSDSLEDYLNALSLVAYENTSEDPSDLIRTLDVAFNDDGDTISIVTRYVDVVPVNDAPEVDNFIPDMTIYEYSYWDDWFSVLYNPETTFSDIDDETLKFSTSRLPQGLSIDPDTGWIWGEVIQPGIFNVDVVAQDSHGAIARETFKLTVINLDYNEADTDAMYGTPYPDEFYAGSRNNSLFTYAERDTLYGEDGDDLLRAGAGNDYLDGGAGNDYLYGDETHDTLLGCDGDDLLRGGMGNDFLDGGTGNDVLYGDEGEDIFVLTSGNGSDIIYEYEQGVDRFGLTDGLTYQDLTISLNGIFTEIRFGSELLASLYRSSGLTGSDFIAVTSFDCFDGEEGGERG